MAFNYKDLTYIRAALQHYEGALRNVTEDECEEEEFSEIQEDIMYLSRLIALTDREIERWESKPPNITSVRKQDDDEDA